MNKQIEELAEAIFQNCQCGLFFSEAEKIADFVINKLDYRKASDVAKEIFAEIEEFMIDNTIYKMPAKSMLSSKFAELKKKYESEKEKDE